MAVKRRDVQLELDFGQDDADTGFTTVSGVCKCGRPWQFRKLGIVKEMSAPCPGCSALIVVKSENKS